MRKFVHYFLRFGLVIVIILSHSVVKAAIKPVPQEGQWWSERQELLNQRVAEAGKKAQLIFIGDSITQGWELEGKETWSQYYALRYALNLGISGDRVQNVLWRLTHGNLEGLSPKAAVLMIGTNNSGGEVSEIIDGVTAIVQLLHKKLPGMKILLLATLPRDETFTVNRGKVLMANQALRRLADNRNIFWLDFGDRYVGADGTIDRDLMPDTRHLSAKGYATWAEAMEGILSSILDQK